MKHVWFSLAEQGNRNPFKDLTQVTVREVGWNIYVIEVLANILNAIGKSRKQERLIRELIN